MADTKTKEELLAELEKVKAEKEAIEKENSELKDSLANANKPTEKKDFSSGLVTRALEFSNERL